MRCREGVRAGEVRGRTAPKVASAAHGVASAAEVAASPSRSVSATATATAAATAAAAAMLRHSQGRRSCNRHAEREGANGSDYISRGRFDHNSPPRFQAGELAFRGPVGSLIRRPASLAVQARPP